MIQRNPDQPLSEQPQEREQAPSMNMPEWAKKATPEEIQKILYPNRGAADQEFQREASSNVSRVPEPKKVERHPLYPNLGAREANEDTATEASQSLDLQDK